LALPTLTYKVLEKVYIEPKQQTFHPIWHGSLVGEAESDLSRGHRSLRRLVSP